MPLIDDPIHHHRLVVHVSSCFTGLPPWLQFSLNVVYYAPSLPFQNRVSVKIHRIPCLLHSKGIVIPSSYTSQSELPSKAVFVIFLVTILNLSFK